MEANVQVMNVIQSVIKSVCVARASQSMTSLFETGRAPGAVVKAVYFESRRSRVEPHSGLQVSKKQNIFPRSLLKIQYCAELT